MRRSLRVTGTLLYVMGMLGLVLIIAPYTLRALERSQAVPSDVAAAPAARPGAEPAGSVLDPSGIAELGDGDESISSEEDAAVVDPADGARRAPPPITRLRLPRIQLEADVVPAPFVDRDGGTWDVPSYKAGHAEGTAGAGQDGNIVILGHLTSLTLGNVFEHLDRGRVGDVVQLVAGDAVYDYRVVDVRRVSRTDVSVLAPTDAASVSLITCAGIWLPLAHDYSERLVVRGELISAPAA